MKNANLIDRIVLGFTNEEAFQKKIQKKNEKAEFIKNSVKSLLIPGKDTFAVEVPNPTTGGIEQQFFLTKQGAMKILDLFNLVPDFHIEKNQVNTPKGPNFLYEVRCDLKDEEGVIVGSGYGVGSSHGFGSSNVAVKMARKSALVDAVIYSLRLDLTPDEDHERYRDPQYEYVESAPNAPQEVERATPDQVRKIEAAAQNIGLDINRILSHYSINSLNELTLDQANELMHYFENTIKSGQHGGQHQEVRQ